MRKLLTGILAASVMSIFHVNAQEKGGMPWSFGYNAITGEAIDVNTAVINLPALNLEAIKIEDDITEETGSGPYRVALLTEADIDVTNSGKFTYLPDGRMIWSAQASIENSLAIDAYLDKFNVPEGVTLYFYNQNRKQVSGGFNNQDVNEYGTLRSEYVQGTTIYMELNIEPWVNLNDIQLHINQLGAAYRGGRVELISNFFRNDGGQGIEADTKTSGQAGPAPDECHVNANCDNWGTTYYKAKQSAVHLEMGGGLCSGNLINNTNLDCTPYLITASHCNAANGKVNSHFTNWRFYFNYESKLCSGLGVTLDDFVTGADFVARSDYPHPPGTQFPALKADWLLLKLRATPQTLASKDLYLAGWDKSGSTFAANQWIGFHHPNGYMKKVTSTHTLSPNGTFNQQAVPNTHWRVDTFNVGGINSGSSGSALFTANNQHIIGVLSGSPNLPSKPGCENRLKTQAVVYSKVSFAWENTQGEGGSTSTSRLKDHLDPAGTGQNTLNSIKLQGGAACGEDVSNKEYNTLSNGILITPNPSSGLVNVKINLPNSTKLSIDVYNILGQKVATYYTNKINVGEVAINMSQFTNGVYMLSIQNDNNVTVTKKVVLRK